MKKVLVYIVILLIDVLLVIGIPWQRKIEEIPLETPAQEWDIRFTWNWENETAKSLAFKDIMQRFEQQNPNVNIQYEYLGNSSFYSNLQVDFASRNYPDVISARPGYLIHSLAMRNEIADITTELGKDGVLSELAPEELIYYKNAVYGLSLEKEYTALLINEDLFEDYGVQIPRTYGQLLDAVARFYQEGIIPIACDLTNNAASVLQMIVGGTASREELDQCLANETLSESYVQGMEQLKQLYENHAFSADAFAVEEEACIRRFLNKEAAMIVAYSGFSGDVGYLYKKSGEPVPDMSNVRIIPFPAADAAGESADRAFLYGFGDASFYLSGKSYHNTGRRAVLRTLLSYLASGDTEILFTENAGILPAAKQSAPTEGDYTLFTAERRTALAIGEEVPMPKDALGEIVWYHSIEQKLPDVLNGKAEIRSVVDEACKEQRRLYGWEDEQ